MTLRTRFSSLTIGACLLFALVAAAGCNLHEDLALPSASPDAGGGPGGGADIGPGGGDDGGGVTDDGGGVSDDGGGVVDDGGGVVDAGDGGEDAGCVPPDADAFCAAYGKNCGEFTGVDTCGATRTVDCGTCSGDDVCGSGSPNVCGCPCEIDGICRPTGAANPEDPCLVCDPARDTMGWSIAEGATCEDGNLCTTGETCDAAGACGGGALIECGSLDDACVAGVCDPNTGACTTTPVNDGGSCPIGLSCASGVCATGDCDAVPNAGSCVIDGVCYDDGAANPANPCEVCDATSPSAWSSAPAGTSCGDTSPSCVESGQCVGRLCELTYRADSCFIFGTCYLQGDANPATECQICDPNIEQTRWTNLPNGATCGSMANCSCAIGFCLKNNGSTCL